MAKSEHDFAAVRICDQWLSGRPRTACGERNRRGAGKGAARPEPAARREGLRDRRGCRRHRLDTIARSLLEAPSQQSQRLSLGRIQSEAVRKALNSPPHAASDPLPPCSCCERRWVSPPASAADGLWMTHRWPWMSPRGSPLGVIVCRQGLASGYAGRLRPGFRRNVWCRCTKGADLASRLGTHPRCPSPALPGGRESANIQVSSRDQGECRNDRPLYKICADRHCDHADSHRGA
jgi:hypothetical protein